MDGTWHPWDDEDEPGSQSGSVDDAGLEALGDYAPDYAGDDEQQGFSSPMYTVTNPPGTVSVTAYLDGRIHRVELSPKVAELSERELAEEVRVICELARQRARSELHAFIVEGVRTLGHDPGAMRDSLIRELDMPTPEQAAAAASRLFRTRYTNDDDGDR